MEQPNLTYIYKLSGGDKDFEKRLFAILKKEFFEEKEHYYQCVSKGDPEKTFQIVHKLKHKMFCLKKYYLGSLF